MFADAIGRRDEDDDADVADIRAWPRPWRTLECGRFRARRAGIIVNISSGTLYHGTKFAVEGQDLVGRLMSALGTMVEQGAPPEMVAEVIHRAVTDGTGQLRYIAGADAEQLIADRTSEGDATFLGGIESKFFPC